MKQFKFAIIPLILAMSGCASLGASEPPIGETPTVRFVRPEPEVKVIVLDPDCAALARYARYVAFLRDSGVNLVDVTVLATDAPAKLAVSVINREVYARPDISPDVGQKNSYEVCRVNTYAKMSAALADAEAKYNELEAGKVKALLETKKKVKKK